MEEQNIPKDPTADIEMMSKDSYAADAMSSYDVDAMPSPVSNYQKMETATPPTIEHLASLNTMSTPSASDSDLKDGSGNPYIPSNTTLVQALYLGIFAILGTLLRIIIAQFFGEECRNPGTVGWLAASSPLCVTADGETEQEGGIVFADLPSNLLGSFIMGFLQDGKTLGLPVDMSIAWLSPMHVFQSMSIIHLGLRTGFCGSLTTLSSWNSEMVVMLFDGSNKLSSQIFKTIFGYVIGMETALGSFVFGTTVARWLHKWMNPLLADEAIAVATRAEEGVHINRDLPEFERRYLPKLPMENFGHVFPINELDCLESWRTSTWEARRVGHVLLPKLIEIEMDILINEKPISRECEAIAHANKWDLLGLKDWKQFRNVDLQRLPSVGSFASEHSVEQKAFKLPVAGLLFGLCMVILGLGLLIFRQRTAYQITDRTSCYAMMFSPIGAILRWRLGKLNGKFTYKNYKWLPIGTLSANLAASFLSICSIAIENRINHFEGFWAIGTVRAIRVGFCGCLSTVSTFVCECAKFSRKHHNDRAYIYIMATLIPACVVSTVLYAILSP